MIKVLRTSFLALLSGSLIGCSDPAERFVDVDAGGHRLHLLVVGDRHQKPTVILESGGRAASVGRAPESRSRSLRR